MGFDNKIKQVMIRNTKHRTLPEVVKLVDAADSKSAVRDDVSVRVRPSGPRFKDPKLVLKAWGFFMAIKNVSLRSLFNFYSSLGRGCFIAIGVNFLKNNQDLLSF